MIKKILFVSLAVSLSACQTVTIPNITQRDIDECKYEAERASPDNPLIAHGIARQCLELRSRYGNSR